MMKCLNCISFLVALMTNSAFADVTNGTTAPYSQSTAETLESFAAPDNTTRTPGSFHVENKGQWFTDGHHFTTERPNSSSFEGIPLFLSALFSLDGDDWDGSGLFVAADLALKQVNDNPDILPGYRLFMTPGNSKCNDGIAIHEFFEQLFHPPTKIALLGPACSTSSQAIASTAHFWNLNVISPSSSSPALSNRKRYPKFFRLIPPETVLSIPRIYLMKRYNWTRVGTIHHNAELFALSNDDLLTRLKENNITIISSESFDDDPKNQVENLKKRDAKIIVINMFERSCRKVFCEAYKLDMYGEGYVWLIPGWYFDGWYKLEDEDLDCTVDEMTHIAESSMYIGNSEKVYGERDSVKVSGITSYEYDTLLKEHFEQERFSGYSLIPEAAYGYDAMWVTALALNKTAEHFREKSLENGQHRNLENFSYSDHEIGDQLFKAMGSVNFTGILGPVAFVGSDRFSVVKIEQFQAQCGDEWHNYDSHCYLFVAPKKIWDEAADHCTDEGGFLVSILSENENKALSEFGHDHISNGITRWWLSLTLSQDRHLHWSGGPKSELEWTPWQNILGEDNTDSNPNREYRDGNNSAVYTEVCFVLDISEKTWVSVNCTSSHSFICKKRAEYEEVLIATYNVNKDEMNWIRNFTWPGGVVPLDHTPQVHPREEEIYEGISLVIYTMTCSVAVCGILFAIVCLTFNFAYRKQRFIKMSSPNLNSLIIIGCILIYTSVFMTGWDSISIDSIVFLRLCQIRIWCLSVGFVLSFGSMFSKTWRVHKVAALKNPKRVIVTDRHLFVMVAALLFVDVVVLSLWFIINPMRVEKKYLPEVEDLDNMVILKPYIQYCTSYHGEYWNGALYSYKSLLLIFGVFLAWETRKVAIPALNDSKLIGICVYNVVLLSAIGVGVNLALTTDPSVSFIFTSVIQIFCTSVTLVIIFIPKMVSVIRYPEGKPVTTMKNPGDTSFGTVEESTELKREIAELRAQLNQLQGQGPRYKHSGCGVWCMNVVCGCCDEIDPKPDTAAVVEESETPPTTQTLS